ncbi:microbial collagenase [Salix suchowensis]|nr:microbial collagenase [Salix suchowensis]
MGSQAAAAAAASHLSCINWVALNLSQISALNPSFLPLKAETLHSPLHSTIKQDISSLKHPNLHLLKLRDVRARATLDESSPAPLRVQEEEDEEGLQPQPSEDVEESVKVLKNAAKTRKVAAEVVLSALSVIEKAKLDPSGFLNTLGGSKSPGRTWMLIFTAEKKLGRGRYFPLTAIQRFDAAGKRIENGVYLGPIGFLTFEGRLSWKNRILAFIFERMRIKIGPWNPFEISLGQKEDREPSKKDPFFIWFYIDEEIAVARGKSGGTAFWCRCRQI